MMVATENLYAHNWYPTEYIVEVKLDKGYMQSYVQHEQLYLQQNVTLMDRFWDFFTQRDELKLGYG